MRPLAVYSRRPVGAARSLVTTQAAFIVSNPPSSSDDPPQILPPEPLVSGASEGPVSVPRKPSWQDSGRYSVASASVKAAVIVRYGARSAIEIREIAKPAPNADEVLVRVHAATVNRTDCGELRRPTLIRLLSGGISRRSVLGMDFSGTIEAVGPNALTLKPGDRVFGMCPFRKDGAQAEYFCMPETGPIALMPTNFDFDQSVVCEGAYYANASVEKFGYRPGHRVLIYGASGAIGTAALQLAKNRGAEVTAVVAGRHIALAQSLGADIVVDYETQAFEELGRQFDFVFDAVGKLGVRRWRRLLKPDGVFASTDLGPWSQNLFLLLWSKIMRNGKVDIPLPPRGSARKFVEDLKRKMEAGHFVPVIDRRYPLAQIADAYRYVQTGEKTGVVVVNVAA